jgi:hypothetical protein
LSRLRMNAVAISLNVFIVEIPFTISKLALCS